MNLPHFFVPLLYQALQWGDSSWVIFGESCLVTKKSFFDMRSQQQGEILKTRQGPRGLVRFCRQILLIFMTKLCPLKCSDLVLDILHCLLLCLGSLLAHKIAKNSHFCHFKVLPKSYSNGKLTVHKERAGLKLKLVK